MPVSPSLFSPFVSPDGAFPSSFSAQASALPFSPLAAFAAVLVAM
jgi:hypothetical protein